MLFGDVRDPFEEIVGALPEPDRRTADPLSSSAYRTGIRDGHEEHRAPAASGRKGTDCMFTATLRCGTVLSYEARTFRPDPGDLVPCRNHGYCVVHGTDGPPSGSAFAPRGRPRAQRELLEWLRGRSETTVHVLRRHGFTLRMITAAEREGFVDLDLVAGRVAVRPVVRAGA